MIDKKRFIISVIMGSILGVVCIIGAQLRSGFEKETIYLFAFWYNRLLMGIIIGLLSSISLRKALLRGFIIGLIVSFAFYSATGFSDIVGFIAGIFYGVIIEYVAYIFVTKNKQLNKKE
ncbi:MAG: hypothetical protein RBT45_06195 [Acholeplasmataceae bacterium]|jgi:hypothetical protein|nr:hypothetical protein [Acholeplasmataceae bacterium]